MATSSTPIACKNTLLLIFRSSALFTLQSLISIYQYHQTDSISFSTPWLTTRRRTCPICKGDVVRSLAASSAPTTPSPTTTSHSHYHDIAPSDPDDVQVQAAETANEAPSSAIPIPRNFDDGDLDLERGDDLAATLVNDQPEGAFSPRRDGWRGLASLSLSAFSGEAAWRQAQADRNR